MKHHHGHRNTGADRIDPLTNVPMLRLLHALVDCHKAELVAWFNVQSRTEIDGRNNPETAQAADTYNNLTFNPDSFIIAHVHQDFRAAIDLSYSAVEAMGPMDRDWEYNKFNDMKNQRLQVITKATASRQGDGSRNDEDDDFINDDVVELGRDYQLSNSLAALGFGSHVLYFDHIINHHCIVGECTQQLLKAIALIMDVSPTLPGTRTRGMAVEEVGKSAVEADIQNAIEKEMKAIKGASPRDRDRVDSYSA
jgi:hypothetical protein